MNAQKIGPWRGTVAAVVAVVAVGGLLVQGNISARPTIDLDGPRNQLADLDGRIASLEGRERLPPLVKEASAVAATLDRCGVSFTTRLQPPTAIDGTPMGPAENAGGSRWHFDVAGQPRLLLSCIHMISQAHDVAVINGAFNKSQLNVVMTVFGSTEDLL